MYFQSYLIAIVALQRQGHRKSITVGRRRGVHLHIDVIQVLCINLNDQQNLYAIIIDNNWQQFEKLCTAANNKPERQHTTGQSSCSSFSRQQQRDEEGEGSLTKPLRRKCLNLVKRCLWQIMNNLHPALSSVCLCVCPMYCEGFHIVHSLWHVQIWTCQWFEEMLTANKLSWWQGC